MPAGEDPDSLVEKAGVAAFQQVMDASLPASAFFLQTLDDGAGAQRSAEAQAELAGEAQRWLELLPDADFREILRAQVMKRFDLPVLTLSGNATTSTHTATPAWRAPREMVVVKPKDKGIQLMARLLLQPQCALPLRRWEYPPEDAELQLFWLYCYALQSSGADSAHAEAFLHQHGVYEAVASAAKLLARLDAQQQRDEFTDMLANLQKNYVSQQARLEKFSVARIKQD